MAKEQSSVAQDVVGLVGLAPWWVGISLAVGSYFGLHHLAERTVVLDSGAIQSSLGHTLWHTVAVVGQWLLPLLFVLGAANSVITRRRRKRITSDMSGEDPAATINNLTWREFEMLVGEAYRLEGFGVQETAAGADGGVDLVLKKGTETILVQCKHWRSQTVGVKVVRELFGVVSARGRRAGWWPRRANSALTPRPLRQAGIWTWWTGHV